MQEGKPDAKGKYYEFRGKCLPMTRENFNETAFTKPGGLGEEGLYHEGTRYLSCMLLEMERGRPFFLSSTVRDENDQLAVALTNPDLIRNGHYSAPALARSLGISQPTVSRCLTALRERGFSIRSIRDGNGWSYLVAAERSHAGWSAHEVAGASDGPGEATSRRPELTHPTVDRFRQWGPAVLYVGARLRLDPRVPLRR